MPAGDAVFVVGETKRLLAEITGDAGAEFAVSSVVAVIHDSEGEEVVNTSGSVDSEDEAASHTIFYAWTPATAGDYTWRLFYTIGSETRQVGGAVLVWPLGSKLDRYVARVQGWLQSPEVGADVAQLSLRDYRDGLAVAALAYSRDNPRLAQQDIELTTAWEYALPAPEDEEDDTPAWVSEFSRITQIEYPVDDTVQGQTFLALGSWRVDERRGVWRLVGASPSAGSTLRLDYTVPHMLSHTADTLRTDDFEWVCEYAAGVLLGGPLANLAAQTEPNHGADVVSYRDQQQRRRQQGQDLMKHAADMWQHAAPAPPEAYSIPTFFGRARSAGRGR